MELEDGSGASTSDFNLQHKLGCAVLKPMRAEAIAADFGSQGVGGQIAAVSVAGAEVHGFQMADSDEIYWLLAMGELWDANLQRDLRFRIIAETATGAAAATAVIFSLAAKGFASGVALTDCKSSPDGSITFASIAMAVAGAPYATAMMPAGMAGTLATFTDTDNPLRQVTVDLMLGCAVTLNDDGGGTDDDIRILAVECYYERQICNWRGMRERT